MDAHGSKLSRFYGILSEYRVGHCSSHPPPPKENHGSFATKLQRKLGVGSLGGQLPRVSVFFLNSKIDLDGVHKKGKTGVQEKMTGFLTCDPKLNISRNLIKCPPELSLLVPHLKSLTTITIYAQIFYSSHKLTVN